MAACPGCGLDLPESDGPTHPYIGASPACWALYGQLLARDYGEYGMPEEHKFVVDAYAVQHPGTDSREARQSVTVHLIRLCLMLEREHGTEYSTRLMSRATNGVATFPWLDPVTPLGTITVQDMLAAPDRDAHIAKSREWAKDVWNAWSDKHDEVRGWCEALEAQLPLDV
jgi:hypothetical protein